MTDRAGITLNSRPSHLPPTPPSSTQPSYHPTAPNPTASPNSPTRKPPTSKTAKTTQSACISLASFIIAPREFWGFSFLFLLLLLRSPPIYISPPPTAYRLPPMHTCCMGSWRPGGTAETRRVRADARLLHARPAGIGRRHHAQQPSDGGCLVVRLHSVLDHSALALNCLG